MLLLLLLCVTLPLVIKPATYHYQVAEAADDAAAPNLVWVDPVTLGILAKLDIASSKYVLVVL